MKSIMPSTFVHADWIKVCRKAFLSVLIIVSISASAVTIDVSPDRVKTPLVVDMEAKVRLRD